MPAAELHEELRDQLLGYRTSRPLAHVDELGGRRDQRQDGRVDERAVHDDVGLAEEPSRLDRQQVGIAGAGPDEMHGHRWSLHSVLPEPSQRPARASSPLRTGRAQGQHLIEA